MCTQRLKKGNLAVNFEAVKTSPQKAGLSAELPSQMLVPVTLLGAPAAPYPKLPQPLCGMVGMVRAQPPKTQQEWDEKPR